MKRSILGLAIVGLVAAAGSANAAVSVSDTFNLSGGVGSYSKTSTDAVDMSAGVAYSMLITSASISGTVLGQSQTGDLTNPLFGNLNALNMVGGGTSNIAAPVTLWSQHYTYTEPGQFVPVYDFTVKLDLLVDRRIRTTLTVTSLGAYLANIFPFTTNSVSVSGIMGAAVNVVPAPTAVVPLAGAGLLTMRRRRR